MIELNIFKTAVAIVLAAKAALFERPDNKYEKAMEEFKWSALAQQQVHNNAILCLRDGFKNIEFLFFMAM